MKHLGAGSIYTSLTHSTFSLIVSHLIGRNLLHLVRWGHVDRQAQNHPGFGEHRQHLSSWLPHPRSQCHQICPPARGCGWQAFAALSRRNSVKNWQKLPKSWRSPSRVAKMMDPFLCQGLGFYHIIYNIYLYNIAVAKQTASWFLGNRFVLCIPVLPDDSGQEVPDWRKHNSTQRASGEESEIFTQQRWTALGDDSFVCSFMIHLYTYIYSYIYILNFDSKIWKLILGHQGVEASSCS